MLKFTERPKTPGMTSKKNIAFAEGNLDESQADMVQFRKYGTRNGLSNIKETFGEILQLQMSVLHQRMSVFQSCWSLKFI